jgi:hypothetical protein
VVYVPFLVFPLIGDSCHSVYNAAITLKNPGHIWEPWMGGLFRLIPKLGFMAGVMLWGVAAWPYRLLNLLIHCASTYLVGRTTESMSGSLSLGFWTAILFAVGFGSYGKSVVEVSSLTMQLGMFFLLLSVYSLWKGRNAHAIVYFLLSASSHEIALAGILLAPLVIRARLRGDTPCNAPFGISGSARNKLAVLLIASAVLALATLLPGRMGRLASNELEAPVMMILPVNPGSEAYSSAWGLPVPAPLITAIVDYRAILGIAMLFVLIFLGRRRSDFLVLALAWIYVFWLPSAWFYSAHDTGRLEIRHAYISSVGACLLASILVFQINRLRRILVPSILAVLVGWSLVGSAVRWKRMEQRMRMPYFKAVLSSFYVDMANLDSHWEYLLESAPSGPDNEVEKD